MKLVLRSVFLLAVFAAASFLLLNGAAAVTGEGNIECDCVITVIPESGTPIHATTTIRGDSEAGIDGGLCQEYRFRTIEYLVDSGVAFSDADQALRNCRDLSETELPSDSEGSSAPTRSSYTPESFGYRNPLGTTNVNTVINRVVRAALGLVGAIFLAVFIYGGALWMTAGGDADKVSRGRSALINAVIGMIVVALSYTILNILFSAAGSLTGGS